MDAILRGKKPWGFVLSPLGLDQHAGLVCSGWFSSTRTLTSIPGRWAEMWFTGNVLAITDSFMCLLENYLLH